MRATLLFFLAGFFTLQLHAQQTARFGTGTTTVQQFGPDVIIRPDTTDQRHVKIATAFNGWIYAAYTVNNSTTGGVAIRRSTDGGATWTNFASGSFSGISYTALDLTVAGLDTINLDVFLAGIAYNATAGTHTVWVDEYHGTTGAFLGEHFTETSASGRPFYDVAIATDYRHPSIVSSPYSIGLVFAKNETYDSVIYVASVNGGATYTTRQPVFSTPRFTHKVDISFGISNTYSNGRYLVAFEAKQNAGDTLGHILFTNNTYDPTSSFQPPIYIDSANNATKNNARDPQIASSNDAIDNNYGDVSALVTMTYFPGYRDVCGIGAVHSINAMLSNWSITSMAPSGLPREQAAIAYNANTRQFYSTCFDTTAKQLEVDTISLNFVNSSWGLFSMGYNNQTTNIKNPWPSISIDPVTGTSNFAWNSEGANGKGIALFDAENNITAIPAAVSNVSAFLYPNPANENVHLVLSMSKGADAVISIVDVNGRLVSGEQRTLDTGDNTMNIDVRNFDNGIYFVRIAAGNASKVMKLVVSK